MLKGVTQFHRHFNKKTIFVTINKEARTKCMLSFNLVTSRIVLMLVYFEFFLSFIDDFINLTLNITD